MRRSFLVPLLGLFLLSGCSLPIVERSALQTVPTKVGTAYPARPDGFTIVVRDERADDAVIGGATSPSQANRMLVLFATDKSGETAGYFKAAAETARSVLGFADGGDATLELTIKRFFVDMHRYGAMGFSAMNCIGYGEIDAALKSSDGAVLRSRTTRVVYWEDTTPVSSIKEVVREAVGRIYTQAAWETTVGILLEQWPSTAEKAELNRLLALARGPGEDVERREAVFWLGLVGRGDGSVSEGLVGLFRASKDQKIAEGAAEAIGMLGIASARAELEGVLSGSVRLPDWENNDTENVWYLLKALAALGTPDLEGRIPPGIKLRAKLTDLLRFVEKGAFPELTEAQREDLEKGKQKLKQ